MTLVRYIGIEDIEHASIADAANILSAGGIIICPTETQYGISVNAANEEMVRKANVIKGRAENEPQIVLLKLEWLPQFVRDYSKLAPFLEAFVPGPLTIISRAVSNKLPGILTPHGNVAFRISSSWFINDLLNEFGKPITSSSANLYGESALTESEDVIDVFWNDVDGMFLVKDVSLSSPPSTIIDVSRFPEDFSIVREGVISRTAIIKALEIA